MVNLSKDHIFNYGSNVHLILAQKLVGRFTCEMPENLSIVQCWLHLLYKPGDLIPSEQKLVLKVSSCLGLPECFIIYYYSLILTYTNQLAEKNPQYHKSDEYRKRTMTNFQGYRLIVFLFETITRGHCFFTFLRFFPYQIHQLQSFLIIKWFLLVQTNPK